MLWPVRKRLALQKLVVPLEPRSIQKRVVTTKPQSLDRRTTQGELVAFAARFSKVDVARAKLVEVQLQLETLALALPESGVVSLAAPRASTR